MHVVAIADGGEGTLEAVGDRGWWLEVDTVDALGRALRAPYVVLGVDVAVVESARTIGLRGSTAVTNPAAACVVDRRGRQLAHALPGPG